MRPFYEKLSPAPGQSFYCGEFAVRAFDSPFHFHSECELTRIVSSRGLRFAGDHIGPFEPGDLALFGPNLPHSYHNDEGARRGPTHARSQVILFASDCLGGILQTAPELIPVRRLLERAGRGLQFTGRSRAWAGERLDALFAAHPAERVPRLLEILIRLARAKDARPLASEGYSPVTTPERDDRIARVIAHVNRHFAEPIYLERAAALAHLTPAAFCRFFRRSTRKTFTAFVNEVRLSQAARLLQETTLSVAEICFRCGFGNIANFNRHFRRLHGVPPRDYRRRQQLAQPTRPPPRFVPNVR